MHPSLALQTDAHGRDCSSQVRETGASCWLQRRAAAGAQGSASSIWGEGRHGPSEPMWLPGGCAFPKSASTADLLPKKVGITIGTHKRRSLTRQTRCLLLLASCAE
ncbi:hypothetical protein HBI56_157810 [Parastagonospora nodorum]|uniref:Uncharacterized protein n=1 Tax=Phaeosphaeria nodorum (strain SN15 / ATCC MYA-4574 / FGSC 10173) TaxID=321614 RepID=A0A7U2EUS2_PHANO|nr:hypothetical protein HBH56_188550 [Parastagonospora nodorum]QRC92253.1 hypothetical protein JI435_023950 [Parastagonospora nodorum SN15]KAH3925121.1 hypothetical protein HBH54_184360 [Parastagonospora nodorum]KAH3953980.1 hypothetical protein HBH53_023710 [Parastagonospora nodorum]KAH3967908.1 hypothetical protein HBH52_184760 [Parastagonospora nodorum]